MSINALTLNTIYLCKNLDGAMSPPFHGRLGRPHRRHRATGAARSPARTHGVPTDPRSPQALGVHGQVRISASPINCPSSIPASRAPAQRPWGSSVTSPTVCCPHGHPLFVPLAGQASVASLLLFVHTKLEDSEEGFIRRVLGATGL